MYNLISNKNFLIFSTSLVIILILLINSNFNQHYIPLISSEFQSFFSWLPLIKSVHMGNLFPSIPSIDIYSSSFLFYPYLTLWTHGLIVSLFGTKGIIIFSTIIFPISTFYILFRIFHRQINTLWSIAISLTCILAFSDWPFRSFLFGIFKGLPFKELATLQPLEITHSPIPSFSIFIFIFIFYYSTVNRKLNLRNITIFTLLWGLCTQIHLIDSLYGIVFWFIYFPIKFYKQSGKELNQKFYMTILSQLCLILILVSPVMIAFYKTIILDQSKYIGIIISDTSSSVDLFYFTAYFLFPIFLTAIIFFVKKIDPYELFTKFLHVYILMFVELLLITSSIFISNSIDIDIIQTRIPLFFLHFYYYVPFVYLVTRPYNYSYSRGIESKDLLKNIEKSMNLIFNKLEKFYLPFIILLLFIFASNSSFLRNHMIQKEQIGVNETINNYKKINKHLPTGVGVVYEEPILNLLSTTDMDRNNSTLWVNRFNNNISTEEIINRLLLYAKIYNWPTEKIIQFLSPGQLQQSKSEMLDLSFKEIHRSGIGYWLIFHKKKMTDDDLAFFLESISKRYNNINTNRLISDFNMNYIFSTKDISNEIPIKSIKTLDIGAIYEIDI